QVCVPSTPAQMYHMIRRQILRSLRKPLIVMTPKSLLRHDMAVSTLEDLANGEFATVIDEVEKLSSANVHRVVLSSGKVYYDLLKARRAANIADVALVRVEQLYPFPVTEMEAVMARYPNAREVVWCQEEPQNQGAWYQIRHRLQTMVGKRELLYAGRKPAAAPATGITKIHELEQRGLIEAALSATHKEDGARETKRLTLTGTHPVPPAAATSRKRKNNHMAIEIKVPQLPESVADATLVTWHKQAGQTVSRDENLADLETDKVVLEVPAPVNGVLKELRIVAGTSVTSGQVLAVLEEGAAAATAAPAAKAAPAAAAKPAAVAAAPAGVSDKLAPSRRRMVEEKQLDPANIPASGRDGRITKGDVVEYLEKPAAKAVGGDKPATAASKSAVVASAAPAVRSGAAGRQDQRVPMTRLRARIAERLLEVQQTQAQLTTFNEIDLKAVM